MAQTPRSDRLKRWEIAIIKAMIARGDRNDQEIQSFFTRPSRTINHARISDIRNARKYHAVPSAGDADLDAFLSRWPNVDTETGAHVLDDELVLKAREAMIAAVHVFNGAGLYFRAEIFIAISIIAWTYAILADLKRNGVDTRHRDRAADGKIATTPSGAKRVWDLRKCLDRQPCPVSLGCQNNLRFLLDLRDEIAHRGTGRIDEAIGAKLQACCLNFNAFMKERFGDRFGLENRLSLALQFATFDARQRIALRGAAGLPQTIASFLDAFENNLTEKEIADPAYRYRVAFVPVTTPKASRADHAIEFFKADSDEAREIGRVLLREVNRPRYTATRIEEMMHADGYRRFNIHAHTQLWQSLNAKDPAKGFGCQGDYSNTWVWFDVWVNRVRAHCEENMIKYR